MADATPDAIETALFEALEAAKVPTGPFRAVRRFAGATTVEGLAAELVGASPSALLALEREQVVEAGGLTTLPLGHVAFLARSTWRVYVVAHEPRGAAPAIKGTAATPGALAGLDAVVTALAGLRVPGLYRGGTVRYVDAAPLPVGTDTALRALVVRFTADRSLAARAAVDTSDALETLGADFHLPEATGWTDPVDQVETDLTE